MTIESLRHGRLLANKLWLSGKRDHGYVTARILSVAGSMLSCGTLAVVIKVKILDRLVCT